MSVDLTCKSVSSASSIRDTVIFKNLIKNSDYCTINSMARSTLLIFSTYDLNLFSPCCHRKNIPLLHLNKVYMADLLMPIRFDLIGKP